MAILNGINIKGTEEVHQLDYEKAIAHKPKLVKSYNDLEEKPFYEKEVKVPFFEKQTYELINKSPDVDSYYINDILIDLEVGKKYYVYFDDVEYECEAFEYVDTLGDESVSVIILGNGALSAPSKVENTGEPFAYFRFIGYSISSFLTETQGAHTLEIKTDGKEIVHISSKYIKDMYYSEQGEVDILPKADYTFALMDETMGLYGNQQSFKLIRNEEYIVEYDGNTYNCLATDLSDETYSLVIIGNLSIMDSSLENTGEPFIIQSSYTNEVVEGGIATKETETVHNIRIYQDGEVIHYLDPKFIKDMYSSKTEQNIIFEEQDVQFVAMSEGGLQGNGYIQQPPIDIDGSKECIVVWDGVEYRCTPMVDSDTEDSREIYVGNLGFLGGNDTGEPFLILDNLQMTVFASPTEGTHKVCVYQMNEIIKQIHSKYVDGYTKSEINEMLGAYVDEVNTLLGGDE